MIARMWRGTTTAEDADTYEAMLKPELLPGLASAPGFVKSYLLRREDGQNVEFITIILFDSLEDVRRLAGASFERSIVPEERKKYLLHHDEVAHHFEVASLCDVAGT